MPGNPLEIQQSLKPKLPPGVRLVSGRYYRVQYVGIVNGKRKQKVHPLTRASEGLAALFRALASMENEPESYDTRIPFRIKLWLQQALPDLSPDEQKEISRMGAEISAAFKEFKVDQIHARHILQFLQQWTIAGKLRTAQRYRATLNKFFRWAIIQGDRLDNPVGPISTKAPPPRTRYLTDAEYFAIREALMGNKDHQASSGAMMQIYVDLLYLTGQRGQDIRSLKWTQIDEVAGVIRFAPSKVQHSTAAKVEIPITDSIANVIKRARERMRARARLSPFVVHNLEGSPYTAHGVGTAWERARKRAGISNATLNRSLAP
jgi:integrase